MAVKKTIQKKKKIKSALRKQGNSFRKKEVGFLGWGKKNNNNNRSENSLHPKKKPNKNKIHSSGNTNTGYLGLGTGNKPKPTEVKYFEKPERNNPTMLEQVKKAWKNGKKTFKAKRNRIGLLMSGPKPTWLNHGTYSSHDQ